MHVETTKPSHHKNMTIRDLLRKPVHYLRQVWVFNRRTGRLSSAEEALNSGASPDDLMSLGTLPIMISFSTSTDKLRKGRNESAELFWHVENATEVILLENGAEIQRCADIGTFSVSPEETTTYSILARSESDETETAHVTVGVYDVAEIIEFSTDKDYVLPTVPFTIKWKVQNALLVKFEGEQVNPEGHKVFEDGVDKETELTLSVTDIFGTIERKLKVKQLPLPFIQALMAPTPNLESNLNISAEMPIRFMDTQIVTANEPVQITQDIEKRAAEMPNIEDMPIFNAPLFSVPQSSMERLDRYMKKAGEKIVSIIENIRQHSQHTAN